MSSAPQSRPSSASQSQPAVDIEAAVELYFLQIFRAARGAGLDDTEAEEITQETFATLLERADDFEGRSQLRTFLFGILYNKLREHRRWLGKQRRQESIDDSEVEDPLDALAGRFDDAGFWIHPPQGPEDFTEARETRQLLAHCMEGAPPAQRMAFLLREVEGLKSAEICKILGVSSTNLGVMMHRFRNRVRSCLEVQGLGGHDTGPRDLEPQGAT